MNSDCQKIKNQIADLVTGILPEAQAQIMEQHLNECAACRDYARALKDEDLLLTEFFAKIDSNITHQQERVLQAINHSGVSKQSETHLIRRTIMRSRITKLAAAAVIIIAILIGIYLFGGSIGGTSVAWADVLENVKHYRTLTWKVVEPDGRFVARMFILDPYYMRGELRDGTIGLVNAETGKVTLINPAEKKAKISPIEQEPLGIYDDYRNFFENLPESSEHIGERRIDEKQAIGFRQSNEFDQVIIWVDPETRLPIRVEFGGISGPEQVVTQAIFTDIVFNAELDEGLFRFDLAGYEVEELDSHREQERLDAHHSVDVFNVVVPED